MNTSKPSASRRWVWVAGLTVLVLLAGGITAAALVHDQQVAAQEQADADAALAAAVDDAQLAAAATRDALTQANGTDVGATAARVALDTLTKALSSPTVDVLTPAAAAARAATEQLLQDVTVWRAEQAKATAAAQADRQAATDAAGSVREAGAAGVAAASGKVPADDLAAALAGLDEALASGTGDQIRAATAAVESATGALGAAVKAHDDEQARVAAEQATAAAAGGSGGSGTKSGGSKPAGGSKSGAGSSSGPAAQPPAQQPPAPTQSEFPPDGWQATLLNIHCTYDPSAARPFYGTFDIDWPGYGLDHNTFDSGNAGIRIYTSTLTTNNGSRTYDVANPDAVHSACDIATR